MRLKYNETATFIEAESGGYRGGKIVLSQFSVKCIFIQTTGFVQTGFQETVDSDAICYPDPDNEFIKTKANRLEGLYIKIPLFGSTGDMSWYKIESVRVNRDHLLSNSIDNLELLLKKTTALSGVS